MITRKSKIKYEIRVKGKEHDKIREILFYWQYQLFAVVSYIIYHPEYRTYTFMFTKKQYELFKRLWDETKNKK